MAISTDNHQRGEVVKPIIKERRFTESEKKKKMNLSTPTNPRFCVSSRDLSDSNQNSLLIEHQQSSRKKSVKVDSRDEEEEDDVSQIFEEKVCPLLESIFGGSNATVFSYGSGNNIMQGTAGTPGLMRLAMSRVLSMCQISGCSARISYYEVYMDRYLDLLQPKTGGISVWDDKDGKVQVRGLSTVIISSMVDFDKELSSGIKRKKLIPTQLNDASSRSHVVLAILVTNGDDSAFATIGKLNLVDLAGNGDIRRTCNERNRIQESGKINQSLLALSNVMSARSDKKSRVPYRDNKLTRILQDSLGGSSMVICLNQGLASPCASRPPVPMSCLRKERLFRSSGKASFASDDKSSDKCLEVNDSDKNPVVVSFANHDGSKITERGSHWETSNWSGDNSNESTNVLEPQARTIDNSQGGVYCCAEYCQQGSTNET